MTGPKTSKGKGEEGSVKKATEHKQDFEVAMDWGDVLEHPEAVQQALPKPLANALAACIRSALAAGALIIVDGVVTLLPEEGDG